MARSALTVQKMLSVGLDMTAAAANVDGNSVRNNGITFLYVDNADASPITVTLITPGQVQGLAIADETITVPATESRFIKLKKVHEQASRDVFVDYSAVTSVVAAAVSL